MRDARLGTFDVVVVWRFDRFARSIEQLVLALAEFRTLGIDFVSSQEALDTSTPMGKATQTSRAVLPSGATATPGLPGSARTQLGYGQHAWLW
jgi:DNA invertase Pin-like site-specific DNA recombinase